MTDKEIDRLLKSVGTADHELDPAVAQRVSDLVLPKLEPVRPLPSAGVLAMAMQAVFVSVAIAGATVMGFNGLHVLNGAQGSLIFWVMGSLGRFAAGSAAAEMVPGSKRPVTPMLLLTSCIAGFIAVFALLFHDYRMDRFWFEGVRCLIVGLGFAAVAAFLLWLIVRRGMVVRTDAAGMAIGTLAGLSGLGMLESHCPILKSMHLMVWHVGVVLLSGLAGYWWGRWLRRA